MQYESLTAPEAIRAMSEFSVDGGGYIPVPDSPHKIPMPRGKVEGDGELEDRCIPAPHPRPVVFIIKLSPGSKYETASRLIQKIQQDRPDAEIRVEVNVGLYLEV